MYRRRRKEPAMPGNLIGELTMYKESGIKPNFSEIARRYGMDRHTVAAHWRAEGCAPSDGRASRAGSFDGHLDEVAAKALLPGVTKKGIHEWLLHRYPDEGLAGYNAFTHFMRRNGISIGPASGPEPHPRFETPPGLQLQFDWKEGIRMADRNGEAYEFNVYSATLGYSRRHVFIRSNTLTTDDLVRCMYETIVRIGGVPREWLTDNMSALVTVRAGRRTRVERASSFARDAGFELKLCRVRSPQTKGKVESSNRFLSRLMAYQGDFEGWGELDALIARIEERCNDEANETTGMPPSVLFMREKDALVPEYVRLVADGRKDLVTALLELTDAQVEGKRRADDDRRVRMANFPYIKTLADFDWGFQPSVPRGTVEQLATLSFLETGDNVIFVGSPGVGKSHLSIALGYEAVLAHKQVYFADCSKLVGDLLHAHAKETLSRRLRFYEHCSLLIIDELGYLDIGKEGADLLFQLVNRRYVLGRSTIVTTNVPVGRWGDVFGSNVTASAIADRLCHHCTLVKITGRSYRLKDVSIGEDDGKGGAS